MSFCPEKIGNSSSSPWKDLGFSPRSTQSCFPLLQGPSCRKSPSALLRSDWVKYDYNRRSDRKKRFFRSNRGLQPSWIGKVQTVISFNWAPGEAGNSSGYRPWRKLRLILKRGIPRFRISRSFLQGLYPELFPASPGAQLKEITVCTFPIQLGCNPRLDRKKRFFRSDRRL